LNTIQKPRKDKSQKAVLQSTGGKGKKQETTPDVLIQNIMKEKLKKIASLINGDIKE